MLKSPKRKYFYNTVHEAGSLTEPRIPPIKAQRFAHLFLSSPGIIDTHDHGRYFYMGPEIQLKPSCRHFTNRAISPSQHVMSLNPRSSSMCCCTSVNKSLSASGPISISSQFTWKLHNTWGALGRFKFLKVTRLADRVEKKVRAVCLPG